MGFNFTVTVPGGSSSAPPGGTMAGFMSTTAAAQRETLRAEHNIGVGEGGFIGFASRTGFTTQVVTSATALVSAINAMAATDRVIFKCQWNGVSNPADYGVGGPSNSAMTANGSVDWGYNRPAHSIIIEPATGYTPTIGIAAYDTSLSFSGTHWTEINDMTFTGQLDFHPTFGFRNGLPIVALNRCKLYNRLIASGIRTLHLDGCTTSGALTGAQAFLEVSPNYLRVWNHMGVGHSNAVDFIHGYGYTEPYQNAWVACQWIAGVKILKMIGVTSGNHFDFHQYAIASYSSPGVENVVDHHVGYHILHEFNVVNGNAEDSQGLFIAQVVPGQANAFLIHNCILTNNAYWAYEMCDPSGTKKGIIDRVLCFRGGLGPGPEPTVTDSVPWIGVSGNSLNAGGALEITNSYFFKKTGTEVQNDNAVVPITVSGNVHMDPRLSPPLTTNRPQDLLTGPWDSLTLNASGFKSYTSPDIAISDPVAAATAFLAFAKPVAGWGVNAGPRDPATWPTNFNQTIT